MGNPHRFDHAPYCVTPGQKVKLSKFSTKAPDDGFTKADARKTLADDIEALTESQRVLWASHSHSLLIILQALDAAGKDSTIRHVMSGVNPQGCSVRAFKAPSKEELEHHFLWRPARALPERGQITIFNRSYYEEVLVVRVHPEFLQAQKLPEHNTLEELWKIRFEEINAFEHALNRFGTKVVKIFLHVSPDEQKQRFLDRLDHPKKNWKFSSADLEERQHWPAYDEAYEQMLEHTSTRWAPWYVIPADNKWFSRALVADIIAKTIHDLDLHYPTVSDEEHEKLEKARKRLMEE